MRKKRVFAIILLITLTMFSLCACEKEGESAKNNTNDLRGGQEFELDSNSLVTTAEPNPTDETSNTAVDIMDTGSQVDWNGQLFSSPAYEFNSDLACFCAVLSQKAYNDLELAKTFRDFGFHGVHLYNYTDNNSLGTYSGTNCFAIAHDLLSINGEDTMVLVVVCRGTNSFDEILGDAFKNDYQNGDLSHPFLGRYVWDHVYDFYDQVLIGIDDYLDRFPEIETSDSLKILITGHSFGGAAANMVGADYTDWLDNITDIYVYTFGAIQVLTTDANESVGYENIHNIYNYYDSFGPHGNYSSVGASSPNAKFGHTELYQDDRLHYDEFLFSFENHDMKNYIAAVNLHRSTGNILHLTCTPPDVLSYDPAEFVSDDTLSGTFRSNDFVAEEFTFYQDGRIELNAFGIIGTGTYSIQDGTLYVEYAFNLVPDHFYTWAPSFSMSSKDVIYIAGTEFYRVN